MNEKTFFQRLKDNLREKWKHIRYPQNYCFICKTELNDETRYRCRFCGKYTCPEHRTTPNHKCRKRPKTFEGESFREIHHADGSITAKGS